MRRLSTILAAAALACGAAPETADSDYTERMAIEHAGDAPVSSGMAERAPGTEVEGVNVSYATVEGKVISGYLARPADAEALPGIVVIHEWWGLNDNIRSMADRLAGQGYSALAVDLYEGGVASNPGEARELMGAAMKRPPQALNDNLAQAIAYLRGELGASAVGTIGWCFGGGWSLNAALENPEGVDASVIYYGRLVTDRDRLAGLRAPILGLFGSEDRGIPVSTVREFEAALDALEKPAEIQVYEGANHAFANPSGTRYDAKAAEDAWARTTAFFDAELR